MHNLLLNIGNQLQIPNFFDQKIEDTLLFSGRRCGTRMCHLEPKGSSEVKKHQLNRTLTVKCCLAVTEKGQDRLFSGLTN